MKVLIAHNRYQQSGGEDQVVSAEAAMLARNGHDIELLSFDNDAISGVPAQIRAAANSFFSVPSYNRALDVMRRFQPDVLHVHNFTPTLSPSIFFAGRKARLAIVQTMHNYRFICSNALLFRDGKPCEKCLDRNSVLPGIMSGCYRGSRAGTAIVGGSNALHKRLGTWTERVDRYIALTQFAAGKLSRAVPVDRIRIKPNFVSEPGISGVNGDFLLFVGRLSQEKGLDTVIAADMVGALPLPVIVIGDGPMRQEIEDASRRHGSRLKPIGKRSGTEVRRWMARAAALLLPSLCYEGFPVTIAEAFSVGLPVIASRIGGLPEIVRENSSGLLHAPGDAASLFATVSQFAEFKHDEIARMRLAARAQYETEYSEAANHSMLVKIYAEAIADTSSSSTPYRTQSVDEGAEHLVPIG